MMRRWIGIACLLATVAAGCSSNGGAVIVLDPATGQLLRLVPAPAKLYPAWSTLNHPGFRVHLATRQVFHEKKLFTIPGLSDYDVQLGFFPDLDYDGSYGRNWRSTLSAHVEEQPGGDVHYIDWTGATHVFGFNGAGFDSPVGCWAVLTAEPGGGWRLAHANRWTKVFDADGAWTGLDRPDGATIQITRMADHRVSSLLTPEGREFLFSYTSHLRLDTVTDWAGREWRFFYDGDARLNRLELPVRVGQLRGACLFTYTVDGYLRTVSNAAGEVLGTATYEADGKVTRIDTIDGFATFADDPGGFVRAVGRNGATWDFFLNAAGQIERRLGNSGTEEEAYTYDAMGRRTSWSRAFGDRFDYTYLVTADPRGLCNVVTRTHVPSDTPATASRTTTWEYVPGTDLPSARIEPDGTRTDWGYDGALNRISMTGAAIGTPTGLQVPTWLWRFDAMNRLVESEDPESTVTRFVYGDGAGVPTDLLVSETGDFGAGDDAKTGLPRRNETITYEYDTQMNVTRRINPDATSTTSTYDSWDRMTTFTDELGTTTTFQYDQAGRPVRHRVPFLDDTGAPVGTGEVTQDYFYDALSRRVETRVHNGFTTAIETRTYAAGGDGPSRVVDAGGRVTTFLYDHQERSTSRTDAAGTAGASTITTTFDAGGNVLRREDELGEGVTRGYDGFQRRISLTDDVGTVTMFAYDAAGRIESETVRNGLGADVKRTRYFFDPFGNTSTIERDRFVGAGPVSVETSGFFYDRRGFIAETVTAAGALVRCCADGLGQVVRIEEPDLDRVTHFTWNNRRRLERREIVAGTVSHIADFTYDDVDRLTSTTRAGVVTSMTWDTLGNPRMFSRDGHTPVQYAYDGWGNLRTASQSSGGDTILESYEYDVAGRMSRRTRTDGVVEDFTRTLHGRLSEKRVAGQPVTQYAYDAAKKLVQRTNAAGDTIDYTYDAAKRIIRQGASTGESKTFSYDALHRVVGGTDTNRAGQSIAMVRGYDSIGNLVEDTQNGMGVRRTYDSWRRLAGLETPNMTYEYVKDTVGRTLQVRRDGNDYLTNAYLPGTYKVETQTHVSGKVDAYEYDAAGRKTRVDSTTVQGVDVDIRATRDSVGKILTQGRQDGSLSETFTYDAHERLTMESKDVPAAAVVAGNPTTPRETEIRYAAGLNRIDSIRDSRDASDVSLSYNALGQVASAGPSVLTYDAKHDATNMFDNRPAYQPAPAGVSRSEYTVEIDAWGRVTEVRRVLDNSLLGAFRYDIWNRPVLAEEEEFNGAQVLTRGRVFDSCGLVYEFSPPGLPGFDLFYVPDPTTAGAPYASGFDDSFFSELLWQRDCLDIPRQLYNVNQGTANERYDDFSAWDTPHFEFPAGTHFRGAPSLQSLVNPPGYASSYATGLMFAWAGPPRDPFLPRPLPHVNGLPAGLDPLPRVDPNPPGGGAPVGPPVQPVREAEKARNSCEDAENGLRDAIKALGDVARELEKLDAEIQTAEEALDKAIANTQSALSDLKLAIESLKEFNGWVDLLENFNTALEIAEWGLGSGVKIATGASKVKNAWTGVGQISSRVRRGIAAGNAARRTQVIMKETTRGLVREALKNLAQNALSEAVNPTPNFGLFLGTVWGVFDYFGGGTIEGDAAYYYGNYRVALMRLQLALAQEERAEKALNDLKEKRDRLLGEKGAAACAQFEAALAAAQQWPTETALTLVDIAEDIKGLLK